MKLMEFIKNSSNTTRIIISIMVIVLLGFLSFHIYVDSQYDMRFLKEIDKHGISIYLFPSHLGYKMSTTISLTYGEIRYDGMEILYNVAKKYKLTHTFVDLGCGVGKALIMARLVGFTDVVGVEILEGRYNIAVNLIKQLPSNITKHIHLYHGDSTQFVPSMTLIKPYFIFISNIMLSNDENIRLFKNLLNNYPVGSIIASSVVPDICIKSSQRKIITKKNTINVPMSWLKISRCHLSIIGLNNS